MTVDTETATTPLVIWTGHPLVDVGVATLCALADKDDPAELTLEDLDKAGEEIRRAYLHPIFSSYLPSVYTKNSPYTNATISAANQTIAINRFLDAFRTTGDDGASKHRCVFTGEPAAFLINRTEMPLLAANGVINFFPHGQGALPVSRGIAFALNALALGGRKSEGKLLIVHCDDQRFTIHFARLFVEDNRRLLSMADKGTIPSKSDPAGVLDRESPAPEGNSGAKLPNVNGPRSLVMNDLQKVLIQSESGTLADTCVSITAYLVSSGQAPSLQIESIPGTLVAFLLELRSAEFRRDWLRIVYAGWFVEKTKGKTKPESSGAPRPKRLTAGKSRNAVYEDLVAIFSAGFTDQHSAARFVGKHLLQREFVDARRIGPVPAKPRINRSRLRNVSWPLVSLFSERLLGMDKKRVEKLKEFADKLATAIHEESDRSLLSGVLYSNDRAKFVATLKTALVKYRKKGGGKARLLFGLDDILQVFFGDDVTNIMPWYLTRDLVRIRLIETLDRLSREQPVPQFALFDEIDEPGDVDISMESDAASTDEESSIY